MVQLQQPPQHLAPRGLADREPHALRSLLEAVAQNTIWPVTRHHSHLAP